MASRGRERGADVVVVGWVVVLTAVLLWPVRHGGFLLGRDMVFTPDQPLDLAAIGLGTGAPRAVPLDVVVALLGHVVGGAAAGRIAVAVPLLVAGWGLASLTRTLRLVLPARLLGAGLAVWNPFTVERLALGQWAALLGYAALPWIVVGVAHTVRGTGARRGRGAAATVLAVALASLAPSGGLLALLVLVAAVVVARVPRRTAGSVVLAAAALQLPWVVAGLVGQATRTTDPAGVAAFAARAELPGPAVVSLLGGGGVWNAAVVPVSRSEWPAWLGLALVVVAVAVGGPVLARRVGRRVTTAVAVAAVLSLAVAALGTWSPTAALLRGALRTVPGAGLLRDGQKWVAVWVLVLVVLAACAVQRWAVQRSVTGRARAALLVATGVAALALPVVVLPDGAATVAPTVTPVHYPAGWDRARALTAGRADVLVLPFAAYRAFAWTGGRPVLDPAPRLLHAPTIVSDDLVVGDTVVAGEDTRAATVGRALTTTPAAERGAALARLGVGWVLVERGTPGAVPDLAAGGLELAAQDADLAVWRVPGAEPSPRASTARVVAAVGAHVLAGLVALVALLVWVSTLLRSSSPHPPEESP